MTRQFKPMATAAPCPAVALREGCSTARESGQWARSKKAETILRFFYKNRPPTMNRIYQGRVTNVEISDPDQKGKWLLFHPELKRARHLTKRVPKLRQKVQAEIEERARLSKEERKQREKSEELQEYDRLRDEQRKEWQDVLWQHHELFQDAVNYASRVDYM